MRYKSIFVILLLGLAVKTFSQEEWFPVGAKWYYDYTSKEGYKEYFTYEVIKDTVILGRDCSKLNARQFSYDNSIRDLGSEYVAQDSNNIYHFHVDTFYLLYDFELKAGDTIDLNLNSLLFPDVADSLSFKHVIDSVGDISIDGVNLKTQYIRLIDGEIDTTNGLIFNGMIIEKIGNISSLFGEPLVVVEMPPWFGPLRCYIDSSTTYKTVSSCDTLITGKENVAADEKGIIIYPCPAKSHLKIDGGGVSIVGLKYHIISNTGKVLLNGFIQPGYIIDVSSLASGIYYLKIAGDDNDLRGKFVKQ